MSEVSVLGERLLLKNRITFLFFATFVAFAIFYSSLSREVYVQHSSESDYLKILDRDDETLVVDKRESSLNYIKLQNIPHDLLELVVKSEDKRFYQHIGVDLLSLLRAVGTNIVNFKVISGASTISQQLARVHFGYKRTILGKLKSIIHGIKLERYYSKGQILELYLNSIPFAYKVTGVADASRYYFSKDLSVLSLDEMATLVVLIRAPSMFAHSRNKVSLLRRRNALLKKLNRSNVEVDVAISREWYFTKNRFPSLFHHYKRRIKDELRMSGVRRTGVVKTTLDRELQIEVQSLVKTQIKRLEDKGVQSAGVIVIHNKTGDVLTYVGSPDFFSEFGGQIDSIRVPRQPGSTMKPFTYAMAIENGVKTNEILPDIEMYFKSGLGAYRPRNYSLSYSGPRTVRESLGNSLNIPALYLVDKIGVTKYYDYISKFGLNLERPSDYYGVGLTLGNAEFTLLDMVRAYSVFANDGVLVTPRFIKSKKIIRQKVNVDINSLRLVTNILQDPYARRGSFGVNSSLDFSFPVASKTGTSTSFRDNWVIGFTPNYTVGVWVGNLDQSEMKNISGITGAGPIYHDVMKLVRRRYSFDYFKKPIGYKKERICKLSGLKANKSCNHTHLEYIDSNGMPLHSCDIHRTVKIRNCFKENDIEELAIYSLAPLYNNWIRKSSNRSVKGQVTDYCLRSDSVVIEDSKKSSDHFKIITPVNKSVYAVDPNIPSKYQYLEFNVLIPQKYEKVSWYVNNQIMKELNRSEVFKWRVEKGTYKIKGVVDNGEDNESDSIIINVL